jgi:trans-aconitate methyltransferase
VVRSTINRIVREKGQDRPARIMSLGCGPAREVELFLGSPHTSAGRAEFTLIDQESQALQYAYEHTYPHVLKTEGRTRVRCVNISFTDILRGTGALGSLPPQDLVYSVGLLDYLVDRRASGLTQRLYETLAPGGLLIIGNMNDVPLSNLWPMEFIADWTLHYRSDADMLAWVKGMNTTSAWTETEPTERVRMLFATRG